MDMTERKNRPTGVLNWNCRLPCDAVEPLCEAFLYLNTLTIFDDINRFLE